ncbi:MAG TPA: hypothetical protein VN651_06550 [Gemmatimonadaceae bacterium]|nr:hypothetical protein [Gemmatimonadaceae bacterium]
MAAPTIRAVADLPQTRTFLFDESRVDLHIAAADLMYSTCIHCHAPLRANEAIELCPIGRRLAFDSHRGRLWVVCTRCREWNLTPIEERWEAIEDCERRFRSAKLRASTDNVGLAQLRDGIELVRIGEPLQPEMAAWRYGAEFRRRRNAAFVASASYLAPMFAVNVLIDAQMVPAAVSALGVSLGIAAIVARTRAAWRPRVADAEGRVNRLGVGQYFQTRIEPNGDGWSLRWERDDAAPALEGHPARRALRSILANVNARGGREDEVRDALDLLDRVGGGERFIERLARRWRPADAPGLFHLSPDVRLALEMALHEETERRALEGELAALESDWRIAEEIASIADNLLVSVDAVQALRSAVSRRGIG